MPSHTFSLCLLRTMSIRQHTDCVSIKIILAFYEIITRVIQYNIYNILLNTTELALDGKCLKYHDSLSIKNGAERPCLNKQNDHIEMFSPNLFNLGGVKDTLTISTNDIYTSTKYFKLQSIIYAQSI